MDTINRFNLVDEPWIPIIGRGFVSLKQVFTEPEYPELGGNPIQKIALTKLLLAIAQAACTPDDEEGWQCLGSDGMAIKCAHYLEKWRDAFWLCGEKPFLQMPEIKKAETLNFNIGIPEVAIASATLISQWQIERKLADRDKALIILTLMGFALGGKKVDNTISLTAGYEKKAAGKPGAHLGYLGYLHNFLTGSNVLTTLWLNLLTLEQLQKCGVWSSGLGAPPWEKMPEGEDCPTARSHKESYQGRLIPLSRFCLLSNEGIHYSEGVSLSTHKEGGVDPSIGIDKKSKLMKAAWVDPEKRPWRLITSFLSFLGKTKTNAFECIYIQEGLLRARKSVPIFGIWSGGLRVSSNAGEQYISGKDDFVESHTLLNSKDLGKDTWFLDICVEMEFLDGLANNVFYAVSKYYKDLKADGANHARIAVNTFWHLCEQHSQKLFCADSPKGLRNIFMAFAFNAYDQICSNETPRQLEAWIKNRQEIKKIK